MKREQDKLEQQKVEEWWMEWASHPMTARVLSKLRRDAAAKSQVTSLTFVDHQGAHVPPDRIGSEALLRAGYVKALEQASDIDKLKSMVMQDFVVDPDPDDAGGDAPLPGFDD